MTLGRRWSALRGFWAQRPAARRAQRPWRRRRPGGAVAPPGSRCLVVGSYPPVPGPASAATLAAVRRCWEDGREVVVASPRPSAARDVVAVGGPAVGTAIARLARLHACSEAVVCLEPGWPFGRRRGRHGSRAADRTERSVRSLAEALSRLSRAELVVTGEVALAPSLFSTLWPVVERVWASSADQAALLKALGAPAVELAVPGSVPFSLSGVGPLEPGALLLVTRGRRRLGVLARAVLGRRAPAVRARLSQAPRRLRKLLRLGR